MQDVHDQLQQKADARDTPSRQEFLESAVFKIEKLTKDVAEKVEIRRKGSSWLIAYSVRGIR